MVEAAALRDIIELLNSGTCSRLRLSTDECMKPARTQLTQTSAIDSHRRSEARYNAVKRAVNTTEATVAFFLPSLSTREPIMRCPRVLLRAIADSSSEAQPRERRNSSLKKEMLYVRLPENEAQVSMLPRREETADLFESTELKPAVSP
jgi:hypothetical protein